MATRARRRKWKNRFESEGTSLPSCFRGHWKDLHTNTTFETTPDSFSLAREQSQDDARSERNSGTWPCKFDSGKREGASSRQLYVPGQFAIQRCSALPWTLLLASGCEACWFSSCRTCDETGVAGGQETHAIAARLLSRIRQTHRRSHTEGCRPFSQTGDGGRATHREKIFGWAVLCENRVHGRQEPAAAAAAVATVADHVTGTATTAHAVTAITVTSTSVGPTAASESNFQSGSCNSANSTSRHKSQAIESQGWTYKHRRPTEHRATQSAGACAHCSRSSDPFKCKRTRRGGRRSITSARNDSRGGPLRKYLVASAVT